MSATNARSLATMSHRRNTNTPPQQQHHLPLVVTLNCIEDCAIEQDSLSGVALIEHVPLSRLSDGKIESAAAVLLHSLAYLPRAAQRRLRPFQLILCLGSADRAVESALAADLGLRLVHVDTSRAEEIADTVMALFLGLLRRTHLLSRHTLSASGWLGSVQPLCRGMRRCRGLVLGIVGRSASARSLATRSLAFKMSVLYFDLHEGPGKLTRSSITFPSAARRMDTLNDLLAASDVISLHCALTNETVQIINEECLQHINLNVMQTLKSIATSRYRTVILSIHQPSFNILSTIDKILLLNKGTVVHHGTLSSLESFLLSNGFTVPPQLNSLEYAMEILNQLQESKPNTPPSLSPSPDNSTISPSDDNRARSIRNKSSRLHEICVLYSRFWKIIYRTRQLLLTNTLEALIVGLVLGTIYINIGYGKQGIEKRFGLFAFTLTFLLSSTTETLPIFINERPILLRETSSGLYRLSSYLIANTLVFLPYLFAIAIIYSVSIYFMVGLCGTWQAFAYFVLVIWVIVLMGNSFVLFLSSLAPNYIAGTSLVTILLGGFFLFSGYFISQDSMPKYWLFMHFFSMYKYALDALLINEYSCLVTKCFLWYQENSSCMVTGGDVLQKRGLHERQRWTNIYVLVGFFVFYRVLCLLVLIRRVSRSKK